MLSPSAEGFRKLSLRPGEWWWSDRYEWFKAQGYTLRPRYSPDWVPSWKGTKDSSVRYEDGIFSPTDKLLDATRDKDGAFVMLKRLDLGNNPDELDIATFLSSEALASDPSNHCIPVYDVLKGDDLLIIVMPLLLWHEQIPWDTFGEVVQFFSQLSEGLQFMHKHRVAHRDCMTLNIMMDAEIYPAPWHPQSSKVARDFSRRFQPITRTQCKKPIRYYLIDFGISLRFDLDDKNPLAIPRLSGDQTAPEFVAGGKGPESHEWLGLKKLYNPFPTDVYYLGNFFRTHIMKGARGFDFMKPLIGDMVQDDPTKRPTMDQVVQRFEAIKSGLSDWKLRSRVREQAEIFSFLPKEIAHWKRRVGYIRNGISPIPK